MFTVLDYYSMFTYLCLSYCYCLQIFLFTKSLTGQKFHNVREWEIVRQRRTDNSLKWKAPQLQRMTQLWCQNVKRISQEKKKETKHCSPLLNVLKMNSLGKCGCCATPCLQPDSLFKKRRTSRDLLLLPIHTTQHHHFSRSVDCYCFCCIWRSSHLRFAHQL